MRLTIFWTPLFIAFVVFCSDLIVRVIAHFGFMQFYNSQQFNTSNEDFYSTVYSCMEIMVLLVPLIRPRIIQQFLMMDLTLFSSS